MDDNFNDANNVDDANNIDGNAERTARQRSLHGLPRNIEVPRSNVAADPSQGGSTGYSIQKRADVITFAVANNVHLAAKKYGVSERSIYRGMQQALPYRQTGNHDRSIIVGEDQLHLAISLFVFPRASADEHCAFIAERSGNVYSRQQFY